MVSCPGAWGGPGGLPGGPGLEGGCTTREPATNRRLPSAVDCHRSPGHAGRLNLSPASRPMSNYRRNGAPRWHRRHAALNYREINAALIAASPRGPAGASNMARADNARRETALLCLSCIASAVNLHRGWSDWGG